MACVNLSTLACGYLFAPLLAFKVWWPLPLFAVKIHHFWQSAIILYTCPLTMSASLLLTCLHLSHDSMWTDVRWNVYSHLLTILNSFCQQHLHCIGLHWSVGVENICWECLHLLVDIMSESVRWQKCLHLSFDRVCYLFQFLTVFASDNMSVSLQNVFRYHLTMCTNMFDIVYTCRGTVAACLLSVNTCRGTFAASLFTVLTPVEGQLPPVCL